MHNIVRNQESGVYYVVRPAHLAVDTLAVRGMETVGWFCRLEEVVEHMNQLEKGNSHAIPERSAQLERQGQGRG